MNSDGCCRKLCDTEDRWSFEKDQGKTLKTRRASSFLQIMISIRHNKDMDKKCIDKAMLCSLVSLPKGCLSRKNAAARRGFIRHLQKHMKTLLTQHGDMHVVSSGTEMSVSLVPDGEN